MVLVQQSSSELGITAESWSSVVIWEFLGKWRLLRRKCGCWIAADEPNAGKEQKSMHVWAGYPLTQRIKPEVGFSLYLPVLQGIQQRSWKTLHTWKTLFHPAIHSWPGTHLQPPSSVRGPFTIRQALEKVLNFPVQSRGAAGFQKFQSGAVWGEAGRGLRPFIFNLIRQRLGLALPLLSVLSRHFTPHLQFTGVFPRALPFPGTQVV